MKTLKTYTSIVIALIISTTIYANNNNTPKGIVYQLTVKSSDISKAKKVVHEYPYLRKVMATGNFYYQFGNYKNFEKVDSIKNKLKNIGCRNVSILAYNNHIQIPLSEAISIQYKHKMLTEHTNKKVAKTITTKEVNYLIQVQQSGLKHYYSLAIPVSSVETVDRILEEIDNEQIIEISLDNNLYSIGNYETFEEVIAARKQFIQDEIYDVFIMAQITDERLDEDDANNLALTIQSVVNELAAK